MNRLDNLHCEHMPLLIEVSNIDKFLGKKLGQGGSRIVYENRLDNSLVVKIANHDKGKRCNVIEFTIWNEIQYRSEIKKWFSPCLWISENGTYLIQKKIEKLKKEDYPKIIPHFFLDLKYSNYGYLNGQGFVCCDYGGFVLTNGFTKRTKKAVWYENR